MAQNELEIIIDAKVQGGVKGVQDTVVALNKMPAAAAKASAGIDKMAKSTAGANVALTNFGRVISDAPFGITAIANNIDPLLESFGRLKKETGSTGGALKALGASLAGPGGLAIGITAATSAIIAFGPVIGRAVSGISAFDQAAREAAEGGAKAFAMAGDKFKQFVDAATDSTNSVARQKDALDDANKALSDYGLKIENLTTLQKQGAQIGAIYAEIKREEAKAAVLAEKAAEEYAKSVGSTIKLQQGDVFGVLGDQSFWQTVKTAFSGANAASQLLNNYSDNLVESADAEKAFGDEAQKSRDKVKDLINQLKGINGVTEDFGKKTKKVSEDVKKSVEEIRKSFSTGFQGLTGLAGLLVDARIQFRKDQIKKEVQDVQSFVNAVNQPVLVPVQLRMDANIKGMLDQIKAAQDAAIKLQTDFNNQVNELAKQMAVGIFTSIGEGIGGMLAGQKSPFAGIISVLADGLKALGKLYIQIGTEMLIAQKAIKAIANNPYLTIAAGIALVALGQVAQGLLTRQTKLAEGGIVSGPTNAMIGEAGQSEVVLPLSRLSGMLSNNRGAVVLETRVSGQDLLLVQARATASQGRTFR